jgi:hypothetical protein
VICRVRGTGHSFHGPGTRSTGRKKYVSDLQVYRAAYRNRTDDLRITRGMVACNMGATCADSTVRCTDGTLYPGLFWLAVPRGVPRREPVEPRLGRGFEGPTLQLRPGSRRRARIASVAAYTRAQGPESQ